MVRKSFGNESLKDVTMERVRVEKFEESLCKDCGSSLHFVGIRGIYTRVGMECEESGFSKQSWLAT